MGDLRLPHRPRLGFLGVGWIGRHRMERIAASGVAEVVAVADPDSTLREQAAAVVPDAYSLGSLDELLTLDLDGVVIATPSALHAEQSIRCLDRGLAVFCQKPLGRDGAETQRVVEAARRADRLLGVDLSYRHVVAMRRVRELVGGGELGEIFAVDLVFHNAYGPDKPWFYDRRRAGGGCVVDLGIHLIDLALWTLDFPEVNAVSGRCFSKGRPLRVDDEAVEDYAVGRLELAGGAVAELACSWHLPAGQDAIIQASFYGSRGGVALKNVNGSFFDFEACRYHGTRTEQLVAPPDDWGGRAAIAWVRQLARDRGFDPRAAEVIEVARAIDALYRAGSLPAESRRRLEATG